MFWEVIDFGASGSGGGDDDYTQDANIVSWWYLDESSGTRYDGSGNNNDLTDTNTNVASLSTTGASVKEGAAAADFENSASEDAHLSIAHGSQTGLDITGNISMTAWSELKMRKSTCSCQSWPPYRICGVTGVIRIRSSF